MNCHPTGLASRCSKKARESKEDRVFIDDSRRFRRSRSSATDITERDEGFSLEASIRGAIN